MKKIYIVLTYTGTILSRIVRKYTKNEFGHVSIALDQDLNKMYSFGRLNPYNPFIGGFVKEGINIGTFKRFKNTKARIYSLEVTDKQYRDLEFVIQCIKDNRKAYKFNVAGLFAIAIKKQIHTAYSFYCAEFVKYVLEKANILKDLPEMIKPNDFIDVQGTQIRYEGKLRNYNRNVPCLFNNMILLKGCFDNKMV